MGLIDRANMERDRFSSLLSENGEKITKTVINTILLMAILAIFGCFDFMTLTFNFDVFDFVNHYDQSIAFWTRVVAKTIAGVCAYNIGMNINWDRELSKAVILQGLIAEYDRLMKFKDDKTFDFFVINVFNRRSKELAWIDKINEKIHRLNKHAKNSDLVMYSIGSEEDKKRNRYCVKRNELEYLKSKEYIENNIDSLKVKYFKVEPTAFNLDIDGKTTVRGAKVQGNVGVAKARRSASIVAGIIMVSMTMASIILGADKNVFESELQRFWFYLLSVVEDISLVCWQIFRGMIDDKRIINSEYTEPYSNRVRILTEYVDWCAEEKKEESKAYRILKALDNAQ